MLSIALLAAQILAPPPLVHIENPGGVAHRVALRCAWPLPRHSGAVALVAVSVGGVPATWRARVRWADGTLALVELAWWEDLTDAITRSVAVRWQVAASLAAPSLATPSLATPSLASSDDEGPHLPMDLTLRSEVEDPWGRTYQARLERRSLVGDPTIGDPGRRSWHAVHEDADGVGFLDVQAELAAGYTPHHAVLTLSLDNGRLRPERGLGAVRFRRFDLVSEAVGVRFMPRFARAHGLAVAEPVIDAGGSVVRGYRQRLLGPSDSLYLGEGTAKSFRLDLFFPEGATEAETAAIAAAVANPITAFPDLEWVRYTRAFGTHGGPAPVLNENERIGPMLAGAWDMGADLGPFGGFGDPKASAAQGAPRHGPSALHSVLRLRSTQLLRVAEAMMLQSLLRPLPGHDARAPAESRALRAGLSRRAQGLPHGFEPLGYEYASVDLLFDYYWLTGERLAHEELVRHGVAIRQLLQSRSFRTSRGEGWCLQALASCGLATGDEELAAWLVDHVRTRILPHLGEHLGVAIAQPPHREVLDGVTPFDAPWQMAALVHGLHAVHRLTGADDVATAAVAVATKMAGPGWLEGVGPKYFVSARDQSQFQMARVGAPADGPGRFQIGAFVLAAELARDQPDLAALFERRARELVQAGASAAAAFPSGLRSDPWFQLWLDRHAAAQVPR